MAEYEHPRGLTIVTRENDFHVRVAEAMIRYGLPVTISRLSDADWPTRTAIHLTPTNAEILQGVTRYSRHMRAVEDAYTGHIAPSHIPPTNLVTFSDTRFTTREKAALQAIKLYHIAENARNHAEGLRSGKMYEPGTDSTIFDPQIYQKCDVAFEMQEAAARKASRALEKEYKLKPITDDSITVFLDQTLDAAMGKRTERAAAARYAVLRKRNQNEFWSQQSEWRV